MPDLRIVCVVSLALLCVGCGTGERAATDWVLDTGPAADVSLGLAEPLLSGAWAEHLQVELEVQQAELLQPTVPCEAENLQDTCVELRGLGGEEAVVMGPSGYRVEGMLPLSLGGLEKGAYLVEVAGGLRVGVTVREGERRNVDFEAPELEAKLTRGLVVGGYRFVPPPELEVVSFSDSEEGYSFHDWKQMMIRAGVSRTRRKELRRKRQNAGYRTYGGRLHSYEPGSRFSLEEVTVLIDTVTSVVLHHDAVLESRLTYHVLAQRGLSTHIMIDGDGTIYQALDLAHAAWASSRLNPTCVAIDLNNPVYPHRKRDDPVGRKRRVVTGEINGEMRESLDYTDAQYESLIALSRELLLIFPQLEPVAPRDEDGEVWDRKVGDIEAFRGFVGHQHYSSKSWDPGPGFEWERFLTGVSGDAVP